MPDDRLREVLSPREIEALDFGLRERVTDVEQPHIRELPQTLPALFAAAARRAEAAGFDGVELHYAHAYTMASFLSARNTRHDGYGGPRENRVRLPLEVFHAVARRGVGAASPSAAATSATTVIDGGNTVDDAVVLRRRVRARRHGLPVALARRQVRGRQAAEGRLGRLSLHRSERLGVHADRACATTAGPFGRNVDPASRIRHAVRDAGL